MTTPAPTPSPLRDDDLRDQHRRTLRRILCNAERRALTADEMRHLRRVTDAEQAESDGARADLATERAIAAADATVWTTAYGEEIAALKQRAADAEADRDAAVEDARRTMRQRQEMAEERHAWQERGDRAEKRADLADRVKRTAAKDAADALARAEKAEERARKAERAADLLAGSHRRAEQAEAAITRVRAVAGWAINGWSDIDGEKVLAALNGTGDAEPEGDTCGGCGHHTTWHRDAGTRPCHKTGCDCAAFTEHGPQRCCVCGSPDVAERGYGTRRYCWPCALNAADPVETTTPVPEPEHRYLSTGCLHGHHAYCQGRTGQAGAKKPAACKFCGARCVCDCHTDAPAEPERRPNCRCRVTPLVISIELDDAELAAAIRRAVQRHPGSPS